MYKIEERGKEEPEEGIHKRQKNEGNRKRSYTKYREEEGKEKRRKRYGGKCLGARNTFAPLLPSLPVTLDAERILDSLPERVTILLNPFPQTQIIFLILQPSFLSLLAITTLSSSPIA